MNNKPIDFTNYFAQLAHSDRKTPKSTVPRITGNVAHRASTILYGKDKVIGSKKTRNNLETESVYYANDFLCTPHDWSLMQKNFDIFFYDSNGKICVKNKEEFYKAYRELLNNPTKYQQRVTPYVS